MADEASSSTANMSASAHAQNGHHLHFQKTSAVEKKSSSDEELMQVSQAHGLFVLAGPWVPWHMNISASTMCKTGVMMGYSVSSREP